MAEWQDPRTFATWLGLVIVVVVMLVGAIIFFMKVSIGRILQEVERRTEANLAYQKDLLRSSVEVQERERSRIAIDLHDDLITKLNVTLLAMNSPKSSPRTYKMLQDSIDLARGISHDLRPPLLEITSLRELILDFLYTLKNIYKIEFYDLSPMEQPVPEDTKLQLFRIFQETINNVVKHAQASSIDIYFRNTQRSLILKIVDDGVGMPEHNGKPQGLGLKSIELRVQLLGGKFRFSTPPNGGVSLLLCVIQDINSVKKQAYEIH